MSLCYSPRVGGRPLPSRSRHEPAKETIMKQTPRVQYTKAADGAQIAYYERGSGPAVLYELSVYTWNIEQEIAFEEGVALFNTIADSAHLVRFDHRGGGMSER